jgi:hypothetical protein
MTTEKGTVAGNFESAKGVKSVDRSHRTDGDDGRVVKNPKAQR